MISSEKSLLARLQRNKRTPNLNDNPDITMIKHILLLALAIRFIAESSVFAADPTPAPSPAKEAVTESASPTASPEKKTRRRTRVEKGVKHVEKREKNQRLRLHRKRLRLHRLRNNKSYFFTICPQGSQLDQNNLTLIAPLGAAGIAS